VWEQVVIRRDRIYDTNERERERDKIVNTSARKLK